MSAAVKSKSATIMESYKQTRNKVNNLKKVKKKFGKRLGNNKIIVERKIKDNQFSQTGSSRLGCSGQHDIAQSMNKFFYCGIKFSDNIQYQA